MESVLVVLTVVALSLVVLTGCGLLADFVLPRCPRLTRSLERLLDVDLKGGYEDE